MTRDLGKMGWPELLAGLDDDLARAEADPSGQRDEDLWKELGRRVDHYAEMVARKPPPRTRAEPGLREDEWEPGDIAQDVCAKLHTRKILAKLRGAREPAGYVVTMLRNAEADRLRGDTRRRVGLRLEHIADFLPAGSADATSPRDRALQHALAQLSEDEHALFHARYEEKRSVGQIADSLGIKYGAAAARLRRLKERVRALMESRSRTP